MIIVYLLQLTEETEEDKPLGAPKGRWDPDVKKDVVMITNFKSDVENDRYLKNQHNGFGKFEASALSKLGFYFTKYKNNFPVIRCYECGLELSGNRNWLYRNALSEHHKRRPQCALNKGWTVSWSN